MKYVLFAIGIAGVAFGLGGLWWWALFGMSPEVGLATMLTSLLMSCCLIFGIGESI